MSRATEEYDILEGLAVELSNAIRDFPEHCPGYNFERDHDEILTRLRKEKYLETDQHRYFHNAKIGQFVLIDQETSEVLFYPGTKKPVFIWSQSFAEILTAKLSGGYRILQLC